MKLLKRLISLSILFGVVSAPSYAITEEEKAAIVEDVARIAQESPELLPAAIAARAAMAEPEEQTFILETAFAAAPEQAALISRAAQTQQISADVIVAAALNVPSVDPTSVTQATAAGPAPAAVAQNLRQRRVANTVARGAGVSPN